MGIAEAEINVSPLIVLPNLDLRILPQIGIVSKVRRF